MGLKIGSQIVEARQRPEVLRSNAAIFNLSRSEHALGDRLSGNPRQHRSPVIQGEL
jgi:hypothetical protein